VYIVSTELHISFYAFTLSRPCERVVMVAVMSFRAICIYTSP